MSKIITIPFILSLSLVVGCNRYNNSGKIEHVYDAGYMMLGNTKKIEHEFEVQNTHGNELIVKDVSKSCNCTEARISNTTIKPGQKEILYVLIKPMAINGSHSIITNVIYEDSTKNDSYSVNYRIYRNIDASIDYIDFRDQRTPKKENRSQSITINHYQEANESNECDVDDINIFSPENFKCSLRKEGTRELIEQNQVSKQAFVVDVEFDQVNKSIPSSNRSDLLKVRCKHNKDFNLNILWKSEGLITVSPNPIVFGNSGKQANDKSKKTIKLTSVDNQSFSVLSCLPENEAIEVKVHNSDSNDQSSKATVEIDLMIDRTKLKKHFSRGEIKIITTHPKQREVSIDWNAIYREAFAPNK